MKPITFYYPLIKNNYIKKMPSELVYHNTRLHKQGREEIFTMISTEHKDRNSRSIMRCYASKDPELPKDNQDALYISFLFSVPMNQGLGSKMLKFAHNYSKQINCKGKIFLMADSCFLPQNAPHIFYKKNGFNTGNKTIDKKLNKFIKEDKNVTYKDFDSIRMHYPPLKYNTPIEIIKNFFSKLFNKQ